MHRVFLVWGIATIVLACVAGYAPEPWSQIGNSVAVVLGIGLGFFIMGGRARS